MRKQIITIVFIIFVILAASAVLLVLRNPQQSLQLPSSPTPTPVGGTTTGVVKSTVKLISINPASNAENVPLDTKLIATFSQTAPISLAIYPGIPFTTSQKAAVTAVTFSQPLDQDVTYSYSFLDANGGVIFTGQFSTGTTSNSIAPLSQSYDNLEPTADQAQQQNYPDVYLANYTPYNASTFSVSSDFDDQKDHFFFTVATNQQQGKEDFQKWLTSLGLTGEEIQKLDIRYQQ